MNWISLWVQVCEGEQYGLTWGDLDFKLRVITLRDTKNGSSRTVPMIDDVLNAFRKLRTMALERKDRAINQPNSAPEDVVFAIDSDAKKSQSFLCPRAQPSHLCWIHRGAPCPYLVAWNVL
jgi:integrase